MPALVTPAPAFVLAPLFAALFLWLCMAVGRRVLLGLGVPRSEPRSERAVVASALGAGLLQFLPFALGALKILSVRGLVVALLVVAAIFFRDLLAVLRGLKAGVGELRAGLRAEAGLCLALAPGILAAVLLALTPVVDTDGLAYHLTVPKRWLSSGTIEYLPTYLYSNTPVGVEMLFTSGLAVAGDSAAKFLHLCLGLLGALALYRAGTRLGNTAIGFFAALLFLAGPAAVTKLLGLAYVEGAIAYALAAAALAWLQWYQEPTQGRLRSLALLAGIALSFKLTALLIVVGLMALTACALIEKARARGEPAFSWLNQAWLPALLVAAPVLPWFVRAYLLTGNPVFPLFAGAIPSRDFSPEMARNFDRYNRYFLWASRYGSAWSIGLRRTILVGVISCVGLAGGFAFLRLRGFLVRATALILALVVAVQLSAVGLYVRYWIPALPVLLLPVLAAFGELLSRPWLRKFGLAAALVGSLAQAYLCLGSVNKAAVSLLKTALGLESQRTFVGGQLWLFPMYEDINRNLPADAHVALTYSCSGFYIDRTTFCTDFPQDALGFASWERFVQSVQGLGITHVVAPRTVADGGPFPPKDESAPAQMFRDRQDQYLRRLLMNHGKLVASALDWGVYELDRKANLLD